MSINTKVHRKLRVLFAGAVIVIAGVLLSGCEIERVQAGTSKDPDTTAETRVFKTNDGRRVTCLVLGQPDSTGQYGGTINPSGLSCDWIHADGSDYMGADE